MLAITDQLQEVHQEAIDMFVAEFGSENVTSKDRHGILSIKVLTQEHDASELPVEDGWKIQYSESDIIDQLKSILWVIFGEEPKWKKRQTPFKGLFAEDLRLSNGVVLTIVFREYAIYLTLN